MRRFALSWATSAAAAVGMVTVAACGGGDSPGAAAASARAAVRILFVGDASGATKAVGEQQLLGARAAVRYWNAHGGFDGRKAEITTVDSNGLPATAISGTVKYLAGHPKPDYVWAGNEGNQIAAMVPVMKKRGLLAGAVNDG